MNPSAAALRTVRPWAMSVLTRRRFSSVTPQQLLSENPSDKLPVRKAIIDAGWRTGRGPAV
jgi:hypothetical protein